MVWYGMVWYGMVWYVCICVCVFVSQVSSSLMNSLLITTTDMGYCIVTFLLLFKSIGHFTEII